MGTIPDVDGGQGPDVTELVGVEPDNIAVPVRVIGTVPVSQIPARYSVSSTRTYYAADGAKRILKEDLTRARAVIAWGSTSGVCIGSQAEAEAGHGQMLPGGTYECFTRDELYVKPITADVWVTVIAENRIA